MGAGDGRGLSHRRRRVDAAAGKGKAADTFGRKPDPLNCSSCATPSWNEPHQKSESSMR